LRPQDLPVEHKALHGRRVHLHLHPWEERGTDRCPA
jgi:hypothetical protein